MAAGSSDTPPVRPVSSSIVKRSSSGPWTRSSAGITASWRRRRCRCPPERGAGGVHPAVLAARHDRVAVEIEGDVRVFLGHHVEMRLEDHPRRALAARRGRLLDHEVADRVLAVPEALARGQAEDVPRQPLLWVEGRGIANSSSKCFQRARGSNSETKDMADLPGRCVSGRKDIRGRGGLAGWDGMPSEASPSVPLPKEREVSPAQATRPPPRPPSPPGRVCFGYRMSFWDVWGERHTTLGRLDRRTAGASSRES